MVLVWVLNFGCKGTPVLVANKNYDSSINLFKISNAKSLAVAAAMPIVAVPIQEVQLLDYAVAHETVNSTYGLTASVDDDIYLGLLDKDPYTSDQQRERDKYQLDDENWNAVVFVEVNGSSTAKLALHKDWIEKQSYEIDAVVNLNLPEQGISGPFRITSIRHILPQKQPVDEDESDDYNYKPVTALFTHVSDQVYDIDFDNGESLGVTYQHPIYSVTVGDWKLVGELEIGEEVLTKSGNTKVVSSSKKEESETVYNLEVNELHNFLVGESGVVVHNSCADEIRDYVRAVTGNSSWVMRKPAVLTAGTKAGCSRCVKYADYNGTRVYYDDNNFPVFEEFAGYGNVNGQIIKYESPDLVGYSSLAPSGEDLTFASNWLDAVKHQYGDNIVVMPNNQVKVANVVHTWHHHQDGKTLFLVPYYIHTISHTGGGAMIKYGLKGAFPGPEF